MLKKYLKTPRDKFVGLFKTILENVADLTENEDFQKKPHLVILGSGGSIGIPEFEPLTRQIEHEGTLDGIKVPTVLVVGDGVPAYIELIELLEATEGIGEFLDRSFLFDQVNPQIQRFVHDPPADEDAWLDRVKRFLKSLRGLERVLKVYLPVENLKITADLTVGKVTFRPHGFERQAIVEPMQRLFEQKQNPPEEMAQLLGAMGTVIREFVESLCCAEVVVKSHECKAKELAYESAREALNLLRCYIPVLYGTGFEHRIGLFDDTERRSVPAVIFHEDGSFSVQSSVSGYNLEYEVEDITLRFLREKGAFDELSGILAKESRSQLEEALTTAVWWIGTGNHLLVPAQQVVAVTTGLEALLIPPKVEDKSEPLAKHAAHLLCTTAEERRTLYKRVKELYGMRSEVVHVGRRDIPSHALADLKYYALAVLVEMARRAVSGWTKVQDLADAVGEVAFGGEPVSREVRLIPRGPIRRPREGRYSTHGKGHPFMLQP